MLGIAAVWGTATAYKVDDRPARPIITGYLLTWKDVANRHIGEFLNSCVVGTRMIHIPFGLPEQHEELGIKRVEEMALL